MTDTREVLDRAVGAYEPRYSEESVVLRARKLQRNRRGGTSAVALALALGSLFVVTRALAPSRPIVPSSSPTGTLILLRASERDILIGHDTLAPADTQIIVASPDGRNAIELTSDSLVKHSPIPSPDGTLIAYAAAERSPGGAARYDLHVMAADGSNDRIIGVCRADCFGKFPVTWSPDGASIVYADGKALWQVPVTGGSPLKRLIGTGEYLGGAAWSPDGTRIAYSHGRFGEPVVTVIAAETHEVVTEFRPQGIALVEGLSWAPDGATIAFAGAVSQREWSIFTSSPDGSDMRRLTRCDENCVDRSPSWSPDGAYLAFIRGDDFHGDAWVMGRDGTEAHQVTSGPLRDTSVSWSAGSLPPTTAATLPSPSLVVVPDVIGMDANEARDALEGAGLVAALITVSDVPPTGLIFDQVPQPGTEVSAGTEVRILVGAVNDESSAVLFMECGEDGVPRVLTPVVRVQPDGLHVVVESQGDADAVLIFQPSRPSLAWSSGSNGLDDEFVSLVPPGDSRVGCAKSGVEFDPDTAELTSFEVIDPDDHWISTDLTCGPIQDDWDMRGWHRVDDRIKRAIEAARLATSGIRDTDNVEYAGYAGSRVDAVDAGLVRVVRDGEVIAWLRDAFAAGWSFSGYACPGSGIGGQ